jgi:hypothetical protein
LIKTTIHDPWEPVGQAPEPHFVWNPTREEWIDPTPTPALRAAFAAFKENEKRVSDAKWDRWYNNLPPDLTRKLSLHDFKRLGDLFKEAFNVS